MASEGDWRLASNGLKPSYLNWGRWNGGPGEPSNGTDEDCARLRTGAYSSWKGSWADTVCTDKTFVYGNNGKISLHALCEYDLLTISSTKGT